jgi:hypothetical protein
MLAQKRAPAVVAHIGFSRASRRASWRSSGCSRGLPAGVDAYVQRRATSHRCQHNTVSARTKKARQARRGSSRLSATTAAGPQTKAAVGRPAGAGSTTEQNDELEQTTDEDVHQRPDQANLLRTRRPTLPRATPPETVPPTEYLHPTGSDVRLARRHTGALGALVAIFDRRHLARSGGARSAAADEPRREPASRGGPLASPIIGAWL